MLPPPKTLPLLEAPLPNVEDDPAFEVEPKLGKEGAPKAAGVLPNSEDDVVGGLLESNMLPLVA